MTKIRYIILRNLNNNKIETERCGSLSLRFARGHGSKFLGEIILDTNNRNHLKYFLFYS